MYPGNIAPGILDFISLFLSDKPPNRHGHKASSALVSGLSSGNRLEKAIVRVVGKPYGLDDILAQIIFRIFKQCAFKTKPEASHKMNK